MATSGSTNFSVTRNDIITKALLKCGVGAEGETLSAQTVADAAKALNGIVKSLQAQGVNIWAYQETVLFLDTSSASYDLSDTSSDRWVRASDLTETTLSADAASGATSITVTSANGFANTYNIGIVQDDSTIKWTTVSNVSGSTITLAAALTDTAASGNAVYVYQNLAPRPLRIEHARVQIDSGSEIPLRKYGRNDYFSLPNKGAAGVPVGYHYQPAVSSGKLYIWPVSDSALYRINATVDRPLEDFDVSSDNPDFPQEWYLPLWWMLAEEMKLEFGVDQITSAEIAMKAAYWNKAVLDFDTDTESVIFVPDFSGP